MRPFLRQEITLDRRGDLDLALQTLLLRDVRQQRGDRLRHPVEGARHLAELVPRLHADAVAEVAALHRLRPLLDAVHRARDREDQHRREKRRDHVEEQQQGGDAEDDVDEDVDVFVGGGAEVVVEEVRERIDDRGEELVAAVFLPVRPMRNRDRVEPDDFVEGRTVDQILGVVVAVDADVDPAGPARAPTLRGRPDAHGHAAVVFELGHPLVVHRLHEDDGARRLVRPRELPRGDEQRDVVAPGHAAERRFLQPVRQLVGARGRGVVDLQRLQRVGGAAPGHAVLARRRLHLPEEGLALAAQRGVRHHAAHHVADRQQQDGEEEERKDAEHHVAEEEAPPHPPEEFPQRPAHRHADAVHAERGEDECGEEGDQDEDQRREAEVAQRVAERVGEHEDDQCAQPDQPQQARPPALRRRLGNAVDRQGWARAQHAGVIRDLCAGVPVIADRQEGGLKSAPHHMIRCGADFNPPSYPPS